VTRSPEYQRPAKRGGGLTNRRPLWRWTSSSAGTGSAGPRGGGRRARAGRDPAEPAAVPAGDPARSGRFARFLLADSKGASRCCAGSSAPAGSRTTRPVSTSAAARRSRRWARGARPWWPASSRPSISSSRTN
jgi:hypothetical protein